MVHPVALRILETKGQEERKKGEVGLLKGSWVLLRSGSLGGLGSSLSGLPAPWGWGVAGPFPLPRESEGRSLGSCQVISSLGLPLQASSHYGEDHKHLQTITPILPLLNLTFWSAAWQTEVQAIHLLPGAPCRPLFGISECWYQLSWAEEGLWQERRGCILKFRFCVTSDQEV